MKSIQSLLFRPIDIAPLVFLRITIGILVPLELLYYTFAQPFLKEFYFEPIFHFKYMGLEWIPEIPGVMMPYFVVGLAIVFLMMAAGWFYDLTSVLSFSGFTYLFLYERASFLNHWYLICLLCFCLVLIPTNRALSLDMKRNPKLKQDHVPAWNLYLVLGLVGLVYFFSGFVKIHPDWLAGQPLDVYLYQATSHLSERTASFFANENLVLAASYGTIILEILAVPLLLWKRSRIFAFVLLVLFHLANTQLFTVGLFPELMICLTLLFFSPEWHRRLLQKLSGNNFTADLAPKKIKIPANTSIIKGFLILFFAVQIFLPFRFYFYKGSGLWTEEGFLFSWRMMMEAKKGNITYYVYEPDIDKVTTIDPIEHGLTQAQYDKLYRNPDLILQYGHLLSLQFFDKSGNSPQVYCDAYLGLNGRKEQYFIHPNKNLGQQERKWLWQHKWVMPLKEKAPSPNDFPKSLDN